MRIRVGDGINNIRVRLIIGESQLGHLLIGQLVAGYFTLAAVDDDSEGFVLTRCLVGMAIGHDPVSPMLRFAY